MSQIRPVRLPDRFYLPRRSYSGQEIFDVVPWDGAVEYVTDGQRYGVRMSDASIRWLEESRVEQFAQDFAGIDLDTLVDGLQEYCRRYQILQNIWKEDIDALQELRTKTGESLNPEGTAARAERPEDAEPGPSDQMLANVRTGEF